jgi:hypothetical protein
MIRAARPILFTFLCIALAASAGCASRGGGAGSRDLHASARMTGDAARVLVVGPALLMHIQVEGRDDLALYTVARKQGTEADCVAGPTGQRRRLRPGVSNLVNLTVAAGETICIAPAPRAGAASVMWHARRIDGGRAQSLALDAVER